MSKYLKDSALIEIKNISQSDVYFVISNKNYRVKVNDLVNYINDRSFMIEIRDNNDNDKTLEIYQGIQ